VTPENRTGGIEAPQTPSTHQVRTALPSTGHKSGIELRWCDFAATRRGKPNAAFDQ
jgi:hypothetical protein